MTLPAVP